MWKLRDYQCGVELINRIYKVVESTGHFPDIHLEQSNQIRAVLWTSSIGKTSLNLRIWFSLNIIYFSASWFYVPFILFVAGGLSMNDFIVAAKLDEIKTSDLAPRKRVWA